MKRQEEVKYVSDYTSVRCARCYETCVIGNGTDESFFYKSEYDGEIMFRCPCCGKAYNIPVADKPLIWEKNL